MIARQHAPTMPRRTPLTGHEIILRKILEGVKAMNLDPREEVQEFVSLAARKLKLDMEGEAGRRHRTQLVDWRRHVRQRARQKGFAADRAESRISVPFQRMEEGVGADSKPSGFRRFAESEELAQPPSPVSEADREPRPPPARTTRRPATVPDHQIGPLVKRARDAWRTGEGSDIDVMLDNLEALFQAEDMRDRRIGELRREGFSPKRIAERLNVSRDEVQKALNVVRGRSLSRRVWRAITAR